MSHYLHKPQFFQCIFFSPFPKMALYSKDFRELYNVPTVLIILKLIFYLIFFLYVLYNG